MTENNRRHWLDYVALLHGESVCTMTATGRLRSGVDYTRRDYYFVVVSKISLVMSIS